MATPRTVAHEAYELYEIGDSLRSIAFRLARTDAGSDLTDILHQLDTQHIDLEDTIARLRDHARQETTP